MLMLGRDDNMKPSLSLVVATKFVRWQEVEGSKQELEFREHLVNEFEWVDDRPWTSIRNQAQKRGLSTKLDRNSSVILDVMERFFDEAAMPGLKQERAKLFALAARLRVRYEAHHQLLSPSATEQAEWKSAEEEERAAKQERKQRRAAAKKEAEERAEAQRLAQQEQGAGRPA